GGHDRVAPAPVRGNVTCDELDVETANAGKEAHACRIVARHDPNGGTVDGEAAEGGHRERVHVEAADARAPGWKRFERHTHHIGAGLRGCVEHDNVLAVAPR